MKILLICNKSPWPSKDGGSLATLSLAKSLSANGALVTILAMNTSKHRVLKNSIPEDITSIINLQLVDINNQTKIIPAILNFFTPGIPYTATRFLSANFQKKLSKIISEEYYDIIQFEGLYLLQYINEIKNICNSRLAYRPHNVEHEIWEGLAKNSVNIFKKIYFRRLSQKIKRLELQLLNSYNLLVPISNSDYATFQSLGNTKPAFVAPFGIFPEKFAEPKPPSGKNQLFFIGALDWLPNQEGLLWFLNNVWPRIKKIRPDLVLKVAGRNIPDKFQKTLASYNIIFMGEIEDAGRFMIGNDIMIVPLFAGSGIRVKIIEGMAHGKPIIATSTAVRGIPVTNHHNIIIADSPENFASGLDELISNNSYKNELAENARLFALVNFNNFEIANSLIKFYQKEA